MTLAGRSYAPATEKSDATSHFIKCVVYDNGEEFTNKVIVTPIIGNIKIVIILKIGVTVLAL